jgi:hypothetical protein
MAYSNYLEGLASKAYSDAAATELATVPPYGTDREVSVYLPLGSVSTVKMSYLALHMYSYLLGSPY